MGREYLSNRVRFAVFRRDSFTCQYCGRRAPIVVLNCDHIFPVARGGSNHPDNLTTACEECNSGKADTLLLTYDPFENCDWLFPYGDDREVF